MKTRALIPLASGVEEMEAVILIDVLRRAEWDVVTVGLSEGPVTASRGVVLVPDTVWSAIDPATFDWIILPGGIGGTQQMMADARVIEALQQHARANKPIAAVCAAPMVLHAAGLLTGRVVTSHPSVAERLGDAKRIDEPVVCDDLLTTSQGPGTTFALALTLVEKVNGTEKANELATAMRLT